MTETTINSESDMARRLEAASAAAREAGKIALKLQSDRAGLGVQSKGLQDFVTRADVQAEKAIRSTLQEQFPMDGFLGEETGGTPRNSGYWVVDPIDGTSNFVRGLRHWGVSIAYVRDRAVQIGVVFDAPNGALYTARRGAGAFRDGAPIRVSQTADLQQAMAILGMSRRTSLDDYVSIIWRLLNAGLEYRRLGSAAIGLVRVAEGVADIYYERHLNIWDAVAGILIVQEAGAVVLAPELEKLAAGGGPVLAGNAFVADQLSFLPTDGLVSRWTNQLVV